MCLLVQLFQLYLQLALQFFLLINTSFEMFNGGLLKLNTTSMFQTCYLTVVVTPNFSLLRLLVIFIVNQNELIFTFINITQIKQAKIIFELLICVLPSYQLNCKLQFMKEYIMNLQQFYNPRTRANQSNKKRALCPYCHTFHSNEEMVDGICPKMKAFALQQQKQYSYICSKCEGEGSFQERVETKILSSAKKYEERWKQWMRVNQHNQHLNDPPERRVIKTDLQSKEVICKQCQGQGVIFRIISKKEGLPGYERSASYIRSNEIASPSVNPVWIRYRMKARRPQGAFHCAICLNEGGTLDKHFKLNCNHEFHYSCIFKWIKLNQKCPICRQIDPFIDVKYIEQHQLVEKKQSQVARRQSQMFVLNQMFRNQFDLNPSFRAEPAYSEVTEQSIINVSVGRDWGEDGNDEDW